MLRLMKFLMILAFMPAQASGPSPQVPTVERVELSSYVGLWHEVRRIENSFQDNNPKGFGVCYNTTAEYFKLPKEKIGVRNTCYRKTKIEVAAGYFREHPSWIANLSRRH